MLLLLFKFSVLESYQTSWMLSMNFQHVRDYELF